MIWRSTKSAMARLRNVSARSDLSTACVMQPDFGGAFDAVRVKAARAAMTATCMTGSAPLQRDTDVPGHATGEVDHLVPHLVAARLQLPFPEIVHLLGQAGQRLFPAGLQVVVDRTPVVGAHHIGKANDLDLGEAVLDGALDDGGNPFERLLVGHA